MDDSLPIVPACAGAGEGAVVESHQTQMQNLFNRLHPDHLDSSDSVLMKEAADALHLTTPEDPVALRVKVRSVRAKLTKELGTAALLDRNIATLAVEFSHFLAREGLPGVNIEEITISQIRKLKDVRLRHETMNLYTQYVQKWDEHRALENSIDVKTFLAKDLDIRIARAESIPTNIARF